MKACDWCSLSWHNKPCELRDKLPEDTPCPGRHMALSDTDAAEWARIEKIRHSLIERRQKRRLEVITDKRGFGSVQG